MAAANGVLTVELVSADRVVWSGEAKQILARTTEGDLGVLVGHAPLLSTLVAGVVEISTPDAQSWVAAVSEGFISVAHNHVSILAEQADMSHDIDLEKAKADLERAHVAGEDEESALEAVALAQARIRAVEMAK